jgi:sugar phosphate isomerase/epimerase
VGQPHHKPFKVILSTIAFRERLLDHALDVAHRLGFEGIELWGREPHISERYDENRVLAARRMIQANELSVPVLGSYLRMGATAAPSDETVELHDTLHIARQLKAQLVRVWMSDTPASKATPEVWDRAISEARHACDCAAKLGLCLVAELHENTLLDTSDHALRAVHRVERDNFRLTYTAGSRADGEEAEARLGKVLPYVAHVHARNFAAFSPRADVPPLRAPLGQGLVDYSRLATRLRDTGYEGYVAIEFAHRDGDAKNACLAADLEYLRSL